MELVRRLCGPGAQRMVAMILTGSLMATVGRTQESDFVGRADQVGQFERFDPVLDDGVMNGVIPKGQEWYLFGKPERAGVYGWINGGFMVCRQGVFDYLKEGEGTIFERAPLEQIAGDGRLLNWPHHGFWKCMDTLRDKNQLEELWASGEAPWRR